MKSIYQLASLLLLSATLQISVIAADDTAYVVPKVTDQVQLEAAKGVMDRLIPEISKHFILEIIPQENGKDVFEIEGKGDQIVFRGTNGVALCSALNWYLKYRCHCHISWCGDQLNIPSPLPRIKEKIRQVSPSRNRVYLNYCVFSYTTTPWHWKRWQREIDWMALNGINTPLAATGAGASWYYTLLEFNFNDLEARSYLTDPAYMAWQWMSNIEGLGGPLAKSVLDKKVTLARKILEQERALGMTPIQQGFSGHVPRLLAEKFPQAKITNKHAWARGAFHGAAQLDPTDPLFDKLAESFYRNQEKLYGTSHIYATDPFHEGSPPVKGAEYLKAVGEKVYQMMLNADSKAVWAMQTWSIRKEIAATVPKGRLLVLDLAGLKMKKLQNFWGHDYVLGTLNNFGGRMRLQGSLNDLAQRNNLQPVKDAPETFAGVGMFMEGIERNPVYFNMYTDCIWRTEPFDTNQWLHQYAQRRYGKKSIHAEKAWDILLNTAYKVGSNGFEKSSVIAARPRIHLLSSGPGSKFTIQYSNAELEKAWHLLLKDAEVLKGSDGYRFDIADTGRQVLSDIARGMHKPLIDAFQTKDKKKFIALKKEFLELFDDMDRLTGTRKEWLLGSWIDGAARWGDTPEEQAKLAFNATMLVTQWGADMEEENSLYDYAWREWNGMIGQYYKGRWVMFFDHLEACLDKGIEYQDSKLPTKYTQPTINANDFLKSLTKWENNWIKNSRNHGMLLTPKGDTVKIAMQLSKKYQGKATEYSDIPYVVKKSKKTRKSNRKRSKKKGGLRVD